MFPYSFKKLVALDISDASIELMSLEKAIFKPKIFSYNRMVLPYGIVFDGKILHPKHLRECLKKLLVCARPNPIEGGLCLVSLPDSQVFTAVLSLPLSLRGMALKMSILHDIETSHPISIKDNYFDFKVVSQDEDRQNIFFTATPKALVYSYYHVLREAGLIPLVFDIETLSLSRALLHPSDAHKTILIVDIGARTTNVGLFENNAIEHIFLIEHGGDSITNRIAGHLKIPLHRAEQMKRTAHIFSRSCNIDVAFAIEEELNSIVQGLKRYIQYHLYSAKTDVDSIILCGGGAYLAGIHKFFQSKFRQNIEIRNPLKKLSISEKDEKNIRCLYFTNVLGLALRALEATPETQGINLLHGARSFVEASEMRAVPSHTLVN